MEGAKTDGLFGPSQAERSTTTGCQCACRNRNCAQFQKLARQHVAPLKHLMKNNPKKPPRPSPNNIPAELGKSPRVRLITIPSTLLVNSLFGKSNRQDVRNVTPNMVEQ